MHDCWRKPLPDSMQRLGRNREGAGRASGCGGNLRCAVRRVIRHAPSATDLRMAKISDVPLLEVGAPGSNRAVRERPRLKAPT
jgi:hypothetical protein